MAKTANTAEEIDLSGFPHNTVTRFEKTLCLACVSDTLTKLLGLAPRTALQDMKGYTPSVAELTQAAAQRPYFEATDPKQHCPYCDSTSRKHARLTTYRIEGGKATDAPRRKLLSSLDETSFTVMEEKATQDEAFADWLARMAQLDQADENWLRNITRVFLERKLPKVNWDEVFGEIWTARRSVRLEEGWEVDNHRLFLSPPLYAEVLVLQYLVSRSQHGGGNTLEGRLTLAELVLRLRHLGYLRAHNIHAHNPADVLEALMHLLAGDGGIKLYFVLDRRDFLAKLSDVKPAAAPPKVASKPLKKAAAKKIVRKAAKKIAKSAPPKKAPKKATRKVANKTGKKSK